MTTEKDEKRDKSKCLTCPKCKNGLENIWVISKCWQQAEIENYNLDYYGEVEEVGETLDIECMLCGEDIKSYLEECGVNTG